MKKIKGFSLTETIVAMTVMLIIILAAYTTVMFSIKATVKAEVKSIALNQAENILTCFKSSDFASGIILLDGIEFSPPAANYTYTFNYNNNGNICPIEERTWYATVTIEGNTIRIAEYFQNGELIYETAYTKASA